MISDMTALLSGSSKTHLGTVTPSGSGHIIRADRAASHSLNHKGFPLVHDKFGVQRPRRMDGFQDINHVSWPNSQRVKARDDL